MVRLLLGGLVVLALALSIAQSPAEAADPKRQLAEVGKCLQKNSPAPVLDFYESVIGVDASRFSSPPPWVAKPVVMFGDMDGGFGRTVLSALRARMVTLQPAGLRKLCRLLVLESASIRRVNHHSLRGYQANPTVRVRQRELLRTISFRRVARGSVIWLGDIVFDRLANNLRVMDTLLRELHRHGALFIRGNHEHYYLPPGSGEVCVSSAWGCFTKSRQTYTVVQFNRLVKAVFRAAFYDRVNRLLFTHNGVETTTSAPDTLRTAFGDLDGFRSMTPEEIVGWIRFRPVEPQRFSGFRPSGEAMELTEIFDDGQRIRLVHGHNSCFFMGNEWVLSLNARLGPQCQTPTASAWELSPA